jgi:hypothetical protein
MEKENRRLQQERDQLRVQLETTPHGTVLSSEEEARLQSREAAWRKQVYVLQNHTARESKRATLDR